MRIPFIDSHTGGEPTRVIPQGAVKLTGSTMAERRHDLATRLDTLRAAMACEPRGNDILVGALLTPPVTSDAIAGVVYFDNVGVIGMCGHGTIGVVETLRYLECVSPGPVRLDTPVGTVEATLRPDRDVELRNVPCRRLRSRVEVQVDGVGRISGDVAYGGNWFFIVRSPHFEIGMDRVNELTDTAWRLRRALERDGITGEPLPGHEGQIDHIFLEGPPSAGSNARNFVLCPGGAYDRSPCGTGTSANVACLFADGKLREREWFVQESVTGSRFRAFIENTPDGLIPTIVGRAFVTAEGALLFDPSDPIAGMTT